MRLPSVMMGLRGGGEEGRRGGRRHGSRRVRRPASIARKHRGMHAGAQLTGSSVFSLGLWSMEWYCLLN